MALRNLQDTVRKLRQSNQLVQVDCEVDPYLEVGAIQRRVYAVSGPALLFNNVKGTAFPMLGNLYGTLARARFLFGDTLGAVEQLMHFKNDPAKALNAPLTASKLIPHLLHALPKRHKKGPLLLKTTSLDKLPQLVSWPKDGGAFITLPQVYSEHPDHPGWKKSNLGMYRVQISGGSYCPKHEAGIHYQIHRGIGVHHALALAKGQPLPVNVFVGGPPSLSVAAVMPLPEGLPELAFAGVLGGHRISMVDTPNGLLAPAEADFCLSGHILTDQTRPEGPFGDHLGYYSLTHNFPVMYIERIYHRPDAIWPFTTVGRPPQEDTVFGQLIHELTEPAVPSLVPGVHAVHAVDAAGVHPLLLALGSERYTPYLEDQGPQELLTQANALLGQGQLSLAKYLIIASQDDQSTLDLHDIPAFFRFVLERVVWARDLHFQTNTTVDTLDYSGTGFNRGSKLIIAASGPPCRTLPTALTSMLKLPPNFSNPQVALPGVLVLQGQPWQGERGLTAADIIAFCRAYTHQDPINRYPLIIVVDNSEMAARNLYNFLWVTFTRSNPAADIEGIDSFFVAKHWGCQGSLIIDARSKQHHAPPLEEDPDVERRVDELGASGGPLHGII
ncbi:MAG: UbiD family decarboxylase [Deltaproteobacteria bacterium]|jgi:4-hydroxy-3-polyprenylbenzoate decarboxylase|nr:UbiD family decarboxylase [Deltaproteobacteria bacterium]